MLNLDNVRKEFAEFLNNDPAGRWRMDAALAHVVTLAYQQGITDGQQKRDPFFDPDLITRQHEMECGK